MRPGEQLKEMRIRLGITTREVEEHSRKIADAEGNDDFYISNAWLTQIENKQSIPSIHKLYSLSIIYRIKFTGLFKLFGVDLEKIGRYQLATPLPKTHLTTLEVYDGDRTVTFPIRFDQGFRPEKTGLLSRMVEIWGEVPIALIQHLDIRHSQYGYIGLEDYALYPLLRPGSFVQIDNRLNKVSPSVYRTEFDRPIYFIELRDGYACSWCELRGNQLTLLPHPLSPCSTRQFACPTEAEIVGRVTAVAMRIVNFGGQHLDAPARLPGRS
jgi:transcriptional regulator with XRE-family HTH domain